MFKKIIVIALCSIITFSPCLCNIHYSFAEDNNSSWSETESPNTFVAALKAYSRAAKNINTYLAFATYDDPINHALVSYAYSRYKRAAETLGISLTELQQNIKYRVNSDGKLEFLYDGSYIQYLNELINQYLIDQGLTQEEIDSDSFDKNVFSGEWFVDNQDNGCFVTYLSTNVSNGKGLTKENLPISKLGTPYRFNDDSDLISASVSNSTTNFSITYTNTNNEILTKTYGIRYLIDPPGYNRQFQNLYLTLADTTGNYSEVNSRTMFFSGKSGSNNNSPLITTRTGNLYIYKLNNNYFLGSFFQYIQNENPYYNYCYDAYINLNIIKSDSTNIDIRKNSISDSNITAGKNAIVNVGDNGTINYIENYINNQNNPDPEVDPDVPDGGEPSYPVPSIPVGIVNNMPIDIQLPNLDDLIPDAVNNIPHGFSIPGLKYKFPFCIPFDLIAVYEVLDATPEAPHFQTSINFATFTYDLDIDLEDYDPYMVHIRNYFLILYIFGLLFITPKLLKA